MCVVDDYFFNAMYVFDDYFLSILCMLSAMFMALLCRLSTTIYDYYQYLVRARVVNADDIADNFSHNTISDYP